jgi:hypothetical protein
MTQYMLSVYMVDGEPTPSDAEMQKMFADVDALNAKMQQKGAWVFGGGLHPAETATVVDARKGDALVTDGPFIEAKEQLGGFWVINAPDLDAALTWAKEASAACQGKVEVRPFDDEPAA